jgi:hypothetical protein
MRWNIKKSEEIKRSIAKDKELMSKLGETIDSVLKKNGVKLGNMSYVFEPRVFTLRPNEIADVMVAGKNAMLKDLIVEIQEKGITAEAIIDSVVLTKCLPECGIISPEMLHVLDRIRVVNKLDDDPVPIINTSDLLMRKIVGNQQLLTELSESVFGILEEHGIKFEKNEGCVFTPCVFEKPVYAQKVSIADKAMISGFGPQIYADPTPEPAIVKIKPFPGIIIDAPRLPPIPGIIRPPWWWIGIPAPEMLRCLDILRENRFIRG